ncbi:MAG: hypothetical protein NVSMB16_08770 [Acidimicrobiales bacterium]
MPTLRIVGPGRAGLSLADALAAAGWQIAAPLGRGDDPVGAGDGVDLCVVATPDAVIAEVAAAIRPGPAVVAHLAGSLGIDVLAGHSRRAALHPLATLPDRVSGAATLRAGVWWAVEGDPLVRRVVAALGGRILEPGDRDLYHATACVAANHTVALMAQLERLAEANGLPQAPFYELAAAALVNARDRGAARALTGPAARGDWATVRRHVDALPAGERDLYLALAEAAASVSGRPIVVSEEASCQ